MKRKTLLALGLGLTFTLGLGSCKDNDLADGGQNPGGDTEQNAALAQKYETLQTLLGSLASVDSLPDNWNSSSYTVSPTVGVLKDDATPHIRYVVTTSQAEADRLYRSYLSKDVTGTPSDDSWQMEGIGSMQFHLENDPNLFATLKVNVQQLPALEEVRFVSEEALGSNGWFSAPDYCYYSFGDVVYQNLDGAPTYWVCVRPCSKSPKKKQSHWCTLQLVPEGSKSEANYVKVGDNCYLPTKLATDKAAAERHIQNFFGVLRLMANPSVARNMEYDGIDEISSTNAENTDATWETLRTTSFMWDYFDLWNPELKLVHTDNDGNQTELTGGVVNKTFQFNKEEGPSDMKSLFGGESALSVDAFYYGYNKNFFATGDYTVYNMHLYAQQGQLFNTVQKQTGYVNKAEAFDFTKFAGGKPEATPVHFDKEIKNKQYQFVVKYRSGAELEGYRHSANDVTPGESFEKRKAKNGMTDVLVSRGWQTRKAYDGVDVVTGAPQDKELLPFFAFGDEVTKAQLETRARTRFCIRNGSADYEKSTFNGKSLNSWMTKALFVGCPGNSYTTEEGITPSDEDVASALKVLATLYLRKDEIYQKEFHMPALDETNVYDQALQRLYELVLFGGHYLQHDLLAGNYTNADGQEVECVVFEAEVKVKGGTYYMLKLVKDRAGDGSYNEITVTKSSKPQLNGELWQLNFYNADDEYVFKDTYSLERTLHETTKANRTALKKANAQEVAGSISTMKFVDDTKK